MTYHQTIIVGNIGNIEMQYLQSGTPVCKLSVAVNEYWNDRQTNERREKTTWYRVSVWGKQGETAHKYLAKGRQVMVIGTVEATAFMGQDGQPRASLELRAREIKFLQGGGGDSSSGGYSGGDSSSGDYDNYSPPPQEMDDIPF